MRHRRAVTRSRTNEIRRLSGPQPPVADVGAAATILRRHQDCESALGPIYITVVKLNGSQALHSLPSNARTHISSVPAACPPRTQDVPRSAAATVM